MKVHIFIIVVINTLYYLIDQFRQQQAARERQLVFVPRKRNLVPKFNLLGLKPTEEFQPYRMGFFQPHGLGESSKRKCLCISELIV